MVLIHLPDRGFRVCTDQFMSEASGLSGGVPLGSIFGPTLFLPQGLPPGQVISHFANISYQTGVLLLSVESSMIKLGVVSDQ